MSKENASKKGRPKGEGYVFQDKDNRWFARLTYTDATGQRRNVKRRADSSSEARARLRELRSEIENHGTKSLQSSRMTFNDLSNHYEENYLREAEYIDGRKVAGLRSVETPIYHLKVLRQYLGRRGLREITYGDIRTLRAERLRTPTKGNKQRSITSVNRELALLRRMLNVAQREGWLIRNPFNFGDPLISVADERKRERILTLEEEARLLAACAHPRRAHLRAIVVAALDTGMRRGELLKLRWSDIDFENLLITVRAFNTKTMRERQIAMTMRLTTELQSLWDESPEDTETLVFGVDSVKRSFGSARKVAGLSDLRFHDLRHTHATRLVASHIPLAEVGRALGHTQANTTYRYVNANVETARRAASVLDTLNASAQGMDVDEAIH